MRKMGVFLFVLIFLTGCSVQLYEPNPTRLIEEAEYREANKITDVRKPLYFIDVTSFSIIAMDKDGELYELPRSIWNSVAPGMMTNEALLSYRKGKMIDAEISKPVLIEANPILLEGTKEDMLPEAARRIIEQYMHTGDVDISIEDFSIDSWTADDDESSSMFDLIITYRVKPNMLAKVWGEVDEEGWTLTPNTHVVTIYGAYEKWLLTNTDVIGNLEVADDALSYDLLENQRHIIQIGSYGYYYEEIAYEDTSDQYPHYRSPIYSINLETGTRTRIYSGDDNAIYYPVYIEGKYIYVETKRQNGEKYKASYFGIQDVQRKWMEEVINEPAFYGTRIGGLIYVFTLKHLKIIDTSTNQVKTAALLPVVLSETDSKVRVNQVVDGIMYVTFEKDYQFEYAYNIETGGFVKVD